MSIHFKDIPAENAVEVTYSFKIKDCLFKDSIDDVILRGYLEHEIYRGLHKEMDHEYYRRTVNEQTLI